MELSLEHARTKHGRSVDRVAELMGLANKWTLYKWLENGRLPAVLIHPFEHATGCDLVTQYLALSDHKLLIDIPTGRAVTPVDANELQIAFSEAMKQLLRHYQKRGNPREALDAIHRVMAGLGYHRENVVKALQPELELFEGEEE